MPPGPEPGDGAGRHARPAAPGSPVRLLAQAEPGGCGEGSGAVGAACLSCAAGEGERLSTGGKQSGEGSYSGGRMKDTGQARQRALTPLKEFWRLERGVRYNAGRTHCPERVDGELAGGFALEGRFVSTCVRWDGAAVLAGWLGERCDVSWSQ